MNIRFIAVLILEGLAGLMMALLIFQRVTNKRSWRSVALKAPLPLGIFFIGLAVFHGQTGWLVIGSLLLFLGAMLEAREKTRATTT